MGFDGQGWESIKELVLAKVPGIAQLYVSYILGFKLRPAMAAKLRDQVRFLRHCKIARIAVSSRASQTGQLAAFSARALSS